MFLRHADRDRRKIPQKRRAAERPPAAADAPQKFRLIPHADLPQLNAGMEHRRQILHQFAKINASVRREIKNDLIDIKGVLHPHQLHGESPGSNLLLTDAKGFLLLRPVLLHPGAVFLRRFALHRFQGEHHR